MSEPLQRSTINVDIGGTFTDCFVAWDGQAVTSKAPTTRYNLEVGFNQALDECAAQLGIDRRELLQKTGIVRYATTLALNALIERKGPKLGLLTTAGFQDTAHIGRGAQWHDGLPIEHKRITPRGERPQPLIPAEMIVGLREQIDAQGNVIVPLSREEAQDKVYQLVDRGAMGFVVVLLFAHANPVHERLVREVIEEIYPPVYLGSQPVILSSEVSSKLGEYARTMTTVLNAYLHPTMAEELVGLGVDLHNSGYGRSLYLVNSVGGCTPLQRTTAVETYNAGPVAGLIGGTRIGVLYEGRNVVATDMGGTSFDIGLVVREEGGGLLPGVPYRHFHAKMPIIGRYRVSISMIETKSIGAGGGSIARLHADRGNLLLVGPDSAGALPGPACYDQGGEDPTVTDADVVLGYINPEHFLGGALPLNPERARKAVLERIAKPLGVSVEEGAWAIKRVVDANMGNEIFKETTLRGYDPREFMMFAYGGAGPTHCCGYGEAVGVPMIVTFPFASVFSAAGIADMDFIRVYEQSRRLWCFDPIADRYLDIAEEYNAVVSQLQDNARHDFRDVGEEADLQFALELDMRYGLQPNVTRVRSSMVTVEGVDDIQRICDAFQAEYARIYSPGSVFPQGGIEILNFVLWAITPFPRREFPVYEPGSADPGAAYRSKRNAYWGYEHGFLETPVYDELRLKSGHEVDGPAIIEAPHTTYVIAPGWRFTVDQYLNGMLRTLNR